MGVDGLWKIIEPAGKDRTFNENCLLTLCTPSRPSFIIGVDISVIMNECIFAAQSDHAYQYKVGKPMQIFFEKLCCFLRESPSVFIFVFDGPQRPSQKRRHQINTDGIPEWVDECKSLIDAFGFYSHQAPGEAEAELAWMSSHGPIDLVLTSDSDALVFGAQQVLRRTPRSKKKEYQYYSLANIEEEVDLTHGGLVLIALLSKSDYSDGLSGCGIKTATALARCGFGDHLIDAFRDFTFDTEIIEELSWITTCIKDELNTNSKGFMNRTYPELAAKLDDSLLSLEQVSLYLNPVTSQIIPNATIPTWVAREPSILKIAHVCMHTFNWKADSLLGHFSEILWPGILLRMIISPLVQYDSSRQLCLTAYYQARVAKIVERKRKGSMGEWTRITFSTDNLVSLLPGLQQNGDRGLQAYDKKIWVSTMYLPESLTVAALGNTNSKQQRKSKRRQVSSSSQHQR